MATNYELEPPTEPLCLELLLGATEDRPLSGTTDKYFISQLYAAGKEQLGDNRYAMACGVVACDRVCEIVSGDGTITTIECPSTGDCQVRIRSAEASGKLSLQDSNNS